MRCKLVVILFILILSTQKAFFTAAESDYAENIQFLLFIELSMNCRTSVFFFFTDLSRPLNFIDFQSKPSFLGLGITAQFFTGGGSTSVTIGLNESKVGTTQGRFIADAMTHNLEQSFGIPILQYDRYYTELGELDFDYKTNFAVIELRDIFMESLPSQGFKQILSSMLLNIKNYTMSIFLGKDGGWSVRFFCGDGTKKLVPDQEQTISLKEITGYSGRIVSAPSSSSSILNIQVFNQISKEYELIINSISPTPTQQGYLEEQYYYKYDVTGSSIEGFSINLKIVFSRIVTIILIVVAQIAAIIISIVIIRKYKK
jgi:hypothetical protein